MARITDHYPVPGEPIDTKLIIVEMPWDDKIELAESCGVITEKQAEMYLDLTKEPTRRAIWTGIYFLYERQLINYVEQFYV